MAETGIIRSVGGIIFDVTVSENHEDKLEITDHPIQSGGTVSDHAYKLPQEVTLTVGKGAQDGEDVPKETYDKILELQASREPFDIVTGKREYKNMLIADITVVSERETENVLMVTLVCREVILVETIEVAVSGKGPTSRQKMGQDTQSTKQGGEKQAQEKSVSSSTLNNLSKIF